MKFIIFLLLIFSSHTWAKTAQEAMLVEKMQWSKEKQLWRLQIGERAGVYWAPNELKNCLYHSVKQQKKVLITFEVKELKFTACKESL